MTRIVDAIKTIEIERLGASWRLTWGRLLVDLTDEARVELSIRGSS